MPQPLDVLKSTSLKLAKEITNNHVYSKRLSKEQRERYIKQRYFYVAASLKDIIRRFKKRRDIKLPNYELNKQLSHQISRMNSLQSSEKQAGSASRIAADNAEHYRFVEFPDKVSISISDPSAGIACVELLRILIDEEGLSFTQAWLLVSRTFNYTITSVTSATLKQMNQSNEAKLQVSEYWDYDIVRTVLPRHAELISILNCFLASHVTKNGAASDSTKDAQQRLARIGLLVQRQEGALQATYIRMNNLCFICAHKAVGVSQELTDYLKTLFFRELDDFFPTKLCNITIGLSQRQWIVKSNTKLAKLLTQTLGGED